MCVCNFSGLDAWRGYHLRWWRRRRRGGDNNCLHGDFGFGSGWFPGPKPTCSLVHNRLFMNDTVLLPLCCVKLLIQPANLSQSIWVEGNCTFGRFLNKRFEEVNRDFGNCQPWGILHIHFRLYIISFKKRDISLIEKKDTSSSSKKVVQLPTTKIFWVLFKAVHEVNEWTVPHIAQKLLKERSKRP